MYRFLILLISLFCFTNAQSYENIRQKIQTLTDKIPASTKYAILIYNLDKKDTIYAYNDRLPVIPASNTKLFTTAVNLYQLGVDYKIATSIYADDIDNNKTIPGNLYIKGFGDPTLNFEDIDNLVNQLIKTGIKRIDGNIVGDESYFDNIYSREDWITDEASNVPLPPIAALALNRNTISIRISAKTKGKKAECTISPNIKSIDIINNSKIVTRRAKPGLRLVHRNNSFAVEISGSFKRRKAPYSYTLHVPNPAHFAAAVLFDKLKAAGIQITGEPISGITPLTHDLICSVEKPLLKVLSIANKRSDNYVTECLFKITGAVFSGKQGNSFYSTQAVLSFLEKNKIYNEGTSLVDGSGISRYNETTVSSVIGLLEKIHNDKKMFDTYYESLSIAGDDGTLRARNFGINFRGKTGTLRDVTTLSGYLDTKNNTKIVLSIMFQYTQNGPWFYKNIQDEIIEKLNDEI